MDMLTFRKQNICQVALNAGLYRDIGNGHHCAKFSQHNGHGAVLDNFNRNRLCIGCSGICRRGGAGLGGRTMPVVLACCLLCPMRPECKRQKAYASNGNAAPDKTFFLGRCAGRVG
ncbi:hypothetical protein ACI01nite_02920 [Acetobacter cibinongensis]|uniref:Uncharacterized protein n=1 Tax=Acetobacter cibinongensis TaxID=146475 RepID=A0A0D6N2W9_9PROT|nr:hypothetical protein Abci_008_203 [Acetobacter cibinongensis]GBQ16758.1 hypothetical protein AA0482_1666 [Acetobacter cibinongensis NRIC 0482]GEL57690.1 hypothetical protein ACI01nite_02920 [Acetobacter cibinongensis]